MATVAASSAIDARRRTRARHHVYPAFGSSPSGRSSELVRRSAELPIFRSGLRLRRELPRNSGNRVRRRTHRRGGSAPSGGPRQDNNGNLRPLGPKSILKCASHLMIQRTDMPPTTLALRAAPCGDRRYCPRFSWRGPDAQRPGCRCFNPSGQQLGGTGAAGRRSFRRQADADRRQP